MTMGKKSPTSIPDAHQETIEQVRKGEHVASLDTIFRRQNTFCLTTSGGSREGPGAPSYFSTKMRPEGRKKFFSETAPPLSQGLDDHLPPPPLSEGLDPPLTTTINISPQG